MCSRGTGSLVTVVNGTKISPKPAPCSNVVVMTVASEDLLVRIRREVDGQMSAYRRKMKAEQLELVEKKYTQKRLLEQFALPRLSLYYFS